MDFKNTGNRVRGMSSAIALRTVLAEAARSEPYKVVSRKVGLSERQVRNIAKGVGKTYDETALAFAIAYPPVRRFFAEVLRLKDGPLDPDFGRKMSEAAQAWMAWQERQK